MRKSVRLAEKETKSRKGSLEETKAKKSRSNNRITAIVTVDPDTMLEVFKYLNYYQLANNSLVSQRFRNLIRTNRHLLALLCVKYICNYNALSAYIRGSITTIELNHENLDRLLTDPFIYICSITVTCKNDTLNLFAAAIGPDRRIRCEVFNLIPDDKEFQNFMEWIYGHVCCDKFVLEGHMDQSHDQALLNFFVTGAQCTSSLTVRHYNREEYLSEVYVDFVKKFMDHKKCDEYLFVDSFKSNLIVMRRFIKELKLQYPKCIVKKETNEDDSRTTYVLEFNNSDIGKKLQVTVIDNNSYESSIYRLFMEIEDL